MAEDNSTFSSLDPLGPEYGGINQPILDQKGLAPFEGDNLSMPEVKTPDVYFPVIPSADGLNKPHQGIRDNVVGSPNKQLPYSKGSATLPSAKDFAKSFKQYVTASQKTDGPQDQYSKIYSYDASPASNAFYDRYAAYGQKKFDEIGFTPLRDNESLYNARTSGWDDHVRMMTHSFWPLFGRGFVSGPKSLWKLAQGDFSADTEDAEAYERAAAIGQSSKKGFGSFFNNTAMNFGYTAGIISEAILEEVAGTLLAPVTGGGSFFAATANNLRKGEQFISGLKVMRGVNEAENVTQGLRALNTELKGLDNIQNARRLFEASKVKSGLTRGVGGWINPLTETTGAVVDIVKNADNLTGMARLASGTSKTVGGLYRDIRGINMALAEARLEGGFVQNKVYQDLYDDYYRTEGKSPDNALQHDMIQQSKEAAATAIMWNTALIYGSNKITFGNIMSPNGGIRKALGAKTDDILNLKYGKVVFEKAKKTATDVKKVAGKALDGEFKYIDKSFKNWAKGLTKDSLAKSTLSTLGYFKGNFAEGIQENLQEVIAQTSEKYYTDSFKNPALKNHLYGKALAQAAIDDQFSAQGFETFASGFFMGMFAAPLNSTLPALSVGYNKMFDTQEYQDYKKTKENIENGLVKTLNMLGADPTEFFESRLFNYAAQDIIARVLEGQSTKMRMDLKEEALIHQITTALDTNTFNYFTDHIKSFKNYTPEEFEEAFGFEKGTGEKYQSRIDSIVQKAEGLKETYKNFNERMPKPVDINKFEPGTEEYKKAAIYDAAWKEGRKNYVFFNQSYKDTTKRMADVTDAFVQQLSKSTANKIGVGDLQILFESERMLNEEEILKTEIETLSQSTVASDKKRLTDKQNKLNNIRAIRKSMESKQLYDTDIEPAIARQKEEVIKSLKAQNIPLPSDEELDQMVREKFAEEGFIAKSEDNERKVSSEYEQAVKNYLKSLGETNGQIMFDADFDEAFEKLKDYNKLNSEAKGIAKYINFLHNPTDFYLHVERNYKWMSDMYHNRKEYYDGLVKQSMEDVELNAILNALAAQNVYVSIEDLADFKTKNIIPREFYDATRKLVIRETSPEYERYMSLFAMALNARTTEAKKDTIDTKLQDRLDELNKEEQDKINSLPTTDTQESLGDLPFGKSKTITITAVNDNLKSGEYALLTYNVKGGTAQLTVYKDGDVLKYDNAEGEVVNLKKLKERFVEAEKYRITPKPNAEDVARIRDEYAGLRADLIETYAEKGAGETVEQYIPVTKDTPVSDMDEELVNQLRITYQNYLEENPDIQEEVTDLSDDEYQERFESFIRTSPEAIVAIENYNRNKQLAIISGQTGVAKAPIITINGVQYDFATLSEKAANDALAQMRTRIADLKQLETDGTIDNVQREELALLRMNLPKADQYVKATTQLSITPEFQETMDKLKTVFDQQQYISKQGEEYYIAYDTIMRRVTTAIRELKSDTFTYKPETDLLATFNRTLAKGDSIDNFINELRTVFSNYTYKQSGFNNKSYDALKEKLEALPKEELTYNTVYQILTEEVSWQTSRDSGNYIDDQIRKLFNNEPLEFDEKIISREAYDNLFGPEGYLTSVKERVDNGELYIASNRLKLFDLNAQVAGEIDLLVVDRKTGAVVIVDVKTGNKDKWDRFNDPKNKYSKAEEYALQLNAYANILYNMTGISAEVRLLPIEISFDAENEKIETATKPTGGAVLPGKLLGELPTKTKDGKSVRDLIDSIIPRIAPKAKEEEKEISEITDAEFKNFIDNGVVSDERLTAIANKYKNNIELTEKEQAIFNDKTAEINAKLIEIAEAESGNDQESLASEMAWQISGKQMVTPEMARTRSKNVQAIERRIELLNKKRALVNKDVETINDTLDFLEQIYGTSVEAAGVEIDALLNRAQGLEALAEKLLGSKAIKKGEKVKLSAQQIRQQIKNEFSVAKDVLNRIKELKAEVEQLEAISKDLKNQSDYYRELIKDKSLTTLGVTELTAKVDKIKNKISKLEKLISLIKNAISKSIEYLKEYLNIWRGTYRETKAFSRETGFAELTRDEISDLIRSTSEADKIKLEEYAGLKKQYEALQQKLNSSMDDVEFMEEVQANEEERLTQLQNKVNAYNNQIRYISDLFDPIFDEITEDLEPLSDVRPEAPKPTATVATAPTVNKRTTEAKVEKKEAEDEIIVEFFPDATVLQPQESEIYKNFMSRIRNARNMEDIKAINASLSKQTDKFTAEDVIGISNAIKEKVATLKTTPTAIELNENNLQKSDNLIVKNAIFINSKLYASAYDTLVVESVDKDGVNVKNVTTGATEKLTFAEINRNTMLKDSLQNTPESTVVVSDEDKDNIKKSNDATIDFIKDPDAKAEAEKYADSKSLDQLEKELYDTNICD
jgi:conjugal transfer/entry exclusion protein